MRAPSVLDILADETVLGYEAFDVFLAEPGQCVRCVVGAKVRGDDLEPVGDGDGLVEAEGPPHQLVAAAPGLDPALHVLVVAQVQDEAAPSTAPLRRRLVMMANLRPAEIMTLFSCSPVSCGPSPTSTEPLVAPHASPPLSSPWKHFHSQT